MSVRPFMLVGGDVLAAAQGLLEAVLGDWCADWGVPREELLVECLRAWEAQPRLPAVPLWRRAWRAGDHEWALAWPAEGQQPLQRLMFVPDRAVADAGVAGLAAATAGAAWQDLLQRWANVLVPGADADDARPAPARAAWQHASGAVLVELRLGRQVCHGVLSGMAVQALARQAALRGLLRTAPSAALPSLDYMALLAPLPVRLPVELGRVEVDLGSLVKLGVGDVIRLDVAADRPLGVAGATGKILFDGYLGLSDGMVALEVARHD